MRWLSGNWDDDLRHGPWGTRGIRHGASGLLRMPASGPPDSGRGPPVLERRAPGSAVEEPEPLVDLTEHLAEQVDLVVPVRGRDLDPEADLVPGHERVHRHGD